MSQTLRFQVPSQLFQNRGDGTFRDVAAQAGVKFYAFTKGVSWGDYDGEGSPDLYVSNFKTTNGLYRNQGNGTFKDVTAQLGSATPSTAFRAGSGITTTTDFWTCSSPATTGASRTRPAIVWDVLDSSRKPVSTKGTAREAFARWPTAWTGYPMQPMGSNFGDLDNDGYLDFYLGTGDPSYSSIVPNLMFLNVAGQRFADISVTGGFAQLQKGHAVAFADLDNDGDLMCSKRWEELIQEMPSSIPLRESGNGKQLDGRATGGTPVQSIRHRGANPGADRGERRDSIHLPSRQQRRQFRSQPLTPDLRVGEGEGCPVSWRFSGPGQARHRP